MYGINMNMEDFCKVSCIILVFPPDCFSLKQSHIIECTFIFYWMYLQFIFIPDIPLSSTICILTNLSKLESKRNSAPRGKFPLVENGLNKGMSETNVSNPQTRLHKYFYLKRIVLQYY
jgi:hypothetical protein